MKAIELHPTEVTIGERFRTDNDLNDEFLDSIRTKGFLQPITVTPDRVLISGGRRLAAALLLQLPSIPAIIRETTGELDLRECELIENLQREDFSWSDRIRLVNRIHELGVEKHGEKWSQQKSADLLERSVGLVNRQLQLSKALKQFPELLKCKTEDEAVKLYRKLGEAVLVKHLVKQSAARNDAGDGAQEVRLDSGELSPGAEGSDRIPLEAPLGVRLARNASAHYRVGDALAGMDEVLSLNSTPNFGLIEVDPPYGIDLKDAKKGESAGLSVYNEVERSAYPQFLHEVCSRLDKLTPGNTRVIFWFGTEWYDTVYRALTQNNFQVDPIPGIWIKPAGQTASPDTYLARCYETFFIAWKGKPPIRQRGRSNVFDFNSVPASKKYHPTQRPLELMQELLVTFAWPGQIVLVPFLGSGTTLRAAYTTGMHAFGWDLEGSYKEQFIAQIEKDFEEGLFDEIEGGDL